MMNRHERRKLKLVLGKQVDKNMAERPCGECTACCTVLAIAELDKPAGVPCEHLGDRGCGIYAARPKACREFQCAWRIGVGTVEQRPDRTGVVLSPFRSDHPCHPGASIHEVWPGAFDDALEFLADAAQGLVLVLVRDGRAKKFLGTEERLGGLTAFIAKTRAFARMT